MQDRQDRATINMLRYLGIGRSVVFQHILDQIDASPGRIHLIAQSNVGWAGGGAKSTMHTIAQDCVRIGNIGISKLGEGKTGLHSTAPFDRD